MFRDEEFKVLSLVVLGGLLSSCERSYKVFFRRK